MAPRVGPYRLANVSAMDSLAEAPGLLVLGGGGILGEAWMTAVLAGI